MEEERFPRGGGSGLDPFEQKKIRKEAFEKAKKDLSLSGSAHKKKQHRPKTDVANDDGDQNLFKRLASLDDVPKSAPTLSFKRLHVGAKVWAAVVEVSPRGLILSLPHGLTGRVPAEALLETGVEGPETIPQAYHIGQLVRAAVTEVIGGEDDDDEIAGVNINDDDDEEPVLGKKKRNDPKKKETRRWRVVLTIDPRTVNAGLGASGAVKGLTLPAVVTSVEDHGAVLSTGISGVTAFLPKGAYPDFVTEKLLKGQLLEVVIVRAAGSRVTVDARSASLATARVEEWPGVNIETLQPGMLVGGTVMGVLPDGIALTFLTFFRGTVDVLHLASRRDGGYSAGQRVNARILYIDPTSKHVLLTLQKGLIAGKLPDSFPSMGQVFEGAEISRILPRGAGLLCALPSMSGQVHYPPAIVPAAQSTEKGAPAKLEKAFAPKQRVTGRVIGFRPMDGLAVMSLRPSIVAQLVLSLADLTPGGPVQGTVREITDTGLIIQVSDRVRGVVPTQHATDVGTHRGLSKYKPGQAVHGLVLDVDRSGGRRLLITLKPSLVRSKLKRLASPEDAVAGQKSHGVVTGISDRGVFVTFFGGLAGRVPLKECGLIAGQEKPADAYTVGQVVKARVLGPDPQGRGLRLSLGTESKNQAGDTSSSDISMVVLEPGSFVYGRVRRVIPSDTSSVAHVYVELREDEDPRSKVVGSGRLELWHLADHQQAKEALAECLREGLDVGRLMILRVQQDTRRAEEEADQSTPRKRTSDTYVVTRKPALMRAVEQGALPANLEQAVPGAIVPGYVVSLTPDAAYVRLLGTLTGRCSLVRTAKKEANGERSSTIAGTKKGDDSTEASSSDKGASLVRRTTLALGQTVRTRITFVDAEKSRVNLALAGPSTSESKEDGTLKAPACGDSAELLSSYFADLSTASAWSEEPTDLDWAAALPIGSQVAATVSETRDYGTLCDLEANEDIVGIAAPEQVDQEQQGVVVEGESVWPTVLDYNPAEGVVDISLLPRLGARSDDSEKKKPKSGLAVGSTVDCRVELVKRESGYCVVSISGTKEDENVAIGFLALTDYNSGGAVHDDAAAFVSSRIAVPEVGTTMQATVACLPDTASANRLILVPVRRAPKRSSTSADARPSASKRARLGPEIAPGTIVDAIVDNVVDNAFVNLTLQPDGQAGCLRAAETDWQSESTDASHLKAYVPGQRVKTVVLGRSGGAVEVTTRRAVLEQQTNTAAQVSETSRSTLSILDPASIKPGASLTGFVEESSAAKGVSCSFGAFVKGRIPPALAVGEPEDVAKIPELYRPGSRLTVTVVDIISGIESHSTTNLIVALSSSKKTSSRFPPGMGDAVLGQIAAVKGHGLDIDLEGSAGGYWGHVPITDIYDGLVHNALEGLSVGQWIRARVVGLPANEENQLLQKKDDDKKSKKKKKKNGNKTTTRRAPFALSLRPSSGGKCAAHAAGSPPTEEDIGASFKDDSKSLPTATLSRSAKPRPGQIVAGYVRGAGAAGVFVTFGRSLVGRLQLRAIARGGALKGHKLSGEKVAQVFKPGTIVYARVTEVSSDGRVELSQAASKRVDKVAQAISKLSPGDAVWAVVTKVESFGVLLQLEGGVQGRAPKSQLADRFVKSPGQLFSPGQRVRARIIEVDPKKRKVILGLKPSYFEGDLAEDMDDEEEGGDLDQELLEQDDEDGSDFEDELEEATAGQDDDGEHAETMDLDDELAGDV